MQQKIAYLSLLINNRLSSLGEPSHTKQQCSRFLSRLVKDKSFFQKKIQSRQQQ